MKEPVVTERSGPSLIWLIPLLTALIGAWLIVRTLTDQGPLVTITFRTAEGIEIDKTRVKYKNLSIGVVESVSFSHDFSRVEVRARLNKDAAQFLRRDTRFWVVRPTLSARGISGLGTLLSGSYIEIEPGHMFQAHDLLSDARYLWHGAHNFILLDPNICPVHVFRLRRHLRTENDFDYFM